MDLFKKNGASCKKGAGYCFHGGCPTPDDQCEFLWGYGSESFLKLKIHNIIAFVKFAGIITIVTFQNSIETDSIRFY